MKYLILPALALGALSLSAVAVHADNHGGSDKGKKFERMDADGDGFVSKAEFLSKAEKKFAKMDSNGDGKISKDEKKAAHEARKAKKADKVE